LLARGRSARSPSQRVGGSGPSIVDIETLRAAAEQRLIQTRFQQRHTMGWSGRFSAPGAEATRNRSVEYAEQGMTHPEVVHAFRELLAAAVRILGETSQPARVVVAVDELDRLPADAARQFVHELKALFTPPLPGCLCMTAVSDEAIREANSNLIATNLLDTSFDAVLRVDQLSVPESIELMRRRTTGIPDPFLWLCHSLSGGLPRELIRLARAMLDHAVSPADDSRSRDSVRDDLTSISRALVAEELAHHSAMLSGAARAAVEPVRDRLVRLLDPRQSRNVDAPQLLKIGVVKK